MTRTTSIRTRLTLWYLLCLCVTLTIFGLGARFALKNSTRAAIDHELEVRLNDVRDFVTQQTRINPAKLAHELREQTKTGLGGGLVELWDDSGTLLFRADGLSDSHLSSQFAGRLSANATLFSTVGQAQTKARAAVRSFTTNGLHFTARVIEPIHQFDEALERFDIMLLLGVPVLVVLAALGGFWISGRALAPVDRLTRDAESIGAMNLSQRVAVPAPNDELRRLALTLNSMLQRLDDAFERLTQFTADASHELRAPLTLIHTAAEFTLRGQRSPEESREALRKILREADRMTALLADLLTLARGDYSANGTSANDDAFPVELSSLVSAAAESVRPAADAKRLSLRVILPTNPLHAKGDPQALSRMLFILLDNAVRYTEEGDSIDIQVASNGTSAEISVSDDGIGIHKDDLPRIWDRFWRADKVRSRNAGGAGLGLSIARSIANHHGAELQAESDLGVGSRFTLRIPLSATEQPQDAAAVLSDQSEL